LVIKSISVNIAGQWAKIALTTCCRIHHLQNARGRITAQWLFRLDGV